ncbi:MAG: V-type ATP synthase subunit E, partial [Acidaminobacteraceae bacterium]
MITIEEKLKMFSNIVVGKINKEFEEVVQRLDKEGQIALDEHKTELQIQALDYEKSIIEKGKTEKNRMISKAKIEKNKHVLNTKNNLVKSVVNALYERVEKFTNENKYQDFIRKLLEKTIVEITNCNGFTLMMTEKDLKEYSSILLDIIKEKKACIVKTETLDNKYIGGFILFNEDKSLKWDCTIKAIINENIELIGRKVNLILDESG